MRHSTQRSVRFFSLSTLLLLAATCGTSLCMGDESAGPSVPPTNQATGPQNVRSGGMLEHSFNYHRQPTVQAAAAAAGPTSARSGGWYHYGFPVQSYRWGYFGAERNYPRVTWHTGWYGDCVKTEIWHGY